MTENNIDILRELTRRLVDMDITHPGAGYVKYDVGGTCIGLNVFNDGSKSIQEIFSTEGAIFPWHNHDTHETVKVVDAKLEIRIEDSDEPIILEAGMSCYFSPGQKHSVKTLEDGWRICIAVPADKAYPIG